MTYQYILKTKSTGNNNEAEIVDLSRKKRPNLDNPEERAKHYAIQDKLSKKAEDFGKWFDMVQDFNDNASNGTVPYDSFLDIFNSAYDEGKDPFDLNLNDFVVK